jgi:hypothetical protein
MLLHFILAAAALFLAGLCNGVMDTLQFHFGASRLAGRKDRFWNPRISWKNKYKQGNPDLGARFPGSTTVFVFVTDAWHLFQFFQLACYKAAVVMAASTAITIGSAPWQNTLAWLAVWVGLTFVISSGFHLSYTVWLPRKSVTDE